MTFSTSFENLSTHSQNKSNKAACLNISAQHVKDKNNNWAQMNQIDHMILFFPKKKKRNFEITLKK